MTLLSDFVHFLVTGIAFVLVWSTQAWTIMFFCEILTPITIDWSPAWHQPPGIIDHYPLLNNLLLLLLFPVLHSATLRGPVKAILDRVIPKPYFETFYAYQSCFSFIIATYMWQPIPTVVWSISSPALSSVIRGIAIFSWLLSCFSELALDRVDLLGFTVPHKLLGWLRGRNKPDSPPEPKLDSSSESGLIVTGIFGVVRHPVYVTILMGIWITPTMTVGRALLASVFTLYVVLAVKYYEEPALVKKFGQEYIEYMERVPCYFPSLNWWKDPAKKE